MLSHASLALLFIFGRWLMLMRRVHEFVAVGRLGQRRFDGIIEVLGWF